MNKIAAVILAFGACSSSSSDPSPIELEGSDPPTATPASRYEAIDVEHGGTIRGVVTWVGPRPQLPPIPVVPGSAVCGASQPHPVFAIDGEAHLADVVVWLEGIARGKRPERRETPATVDQVSCRYVPHVLAVGVGDRVTFENSDAVMHNVHGTRGSRDWINLGQPEVNDANTETIANAGVFKLVCDAGHPWMLGWMHAFDHPYYAVTGSDGAFELSGVPPGEYTLRAWHEGARVRGTSSGRPIYDEPYVETARVTVTADGTVEHRFEMSMPQDPAPPPTATPTPTEPTSPPVTTPPQ